MSRRNTTTQRFEAVLHDHDRLLEARVPRVLASSEPCHKTGYASEMLARNAAILHLISLPGCVGVAAYECQFTDNNGERWCPEGTWHFGHHGTSATCHEDAQDIVSIRRSRMAASGDARSRLNHGGGRRSARAGKGRRQARLNATGASS